ncbi:uncharacterized protein LOC129311826 [Prosopis cineraria]|uniref:uncharacterized protein LOC129311826 n=1 Tax=Prosopis cineraria TaxID=364024 RepID=UPI00240EB2B3|nr:uncharacterized protein LOC129311826 [Prosopis cineraria]
MSDREDDNDAPEEFTAEQGVQQEEEIRKIQKESKVRLIREKKERRRKLAQRLTPRPSKSSKDSQDVSETETETEQVSTEDAGFLPDDIVQMLAAGEKQVFPSDSNDDGAKVEPTLRKKKSKKTSLDYDGDSVILDDIGPPPCLQSSLEFLKRRKMEVSRSSSVLNNSNRALRLLTSSGVLGRN